MTPLDDLKALYLANRDKFKFNPLLREIRELIRKHDPKWDEQDALKPKPSPYKMTIVFPGADKPTEVK